MKKRISIVLVTVLLAALLSVGASAAGSGQFGGNLWWSVDDNGLLTIWGSGPMPNGTVTEDEPWFEFRNTIRSVVIANGVTSIGDMTFLNCTNLQSIQIPATVTSIGYYAFGYCPALTNVNFARPKEQWDRIPIGGGNDSLTAATITYGPSVQRTAQALRVDGAAQSTEIYNIDGYNYFKLRDIAMLLNGTGSQFAVGYDEASATIRVTTGEAYTPVGGELAMGTDNSIMAEPSSQPLLVNGKTVSLAAYNIGGYNFFQLRALGKALNFNVDYETSTETMIIKSVSLYTPVARGNCGESATWVLYEDGLLTISGNGPMADYTNNYPAPWNDRREDIISVVVEPGVTTVGNRAFYYCSGLTSVTIPDSVTSIGGWVFAHCSALTSVTIPDSVMSIEDGAFSSCNGLTSVVIPDSVAGIGDFAFNGCSGLTNVYFGGSEQQWSTIKIRIGNDYLTSATISYNAR